MTFTLSSTVSRARAIKDLTLARAGELIVWVSRLIVKWFQEITVHALSKCSMKFPLFTLKTFFSALCNTIFGNAATCYLFCVYIYINIYTIANFFLYCNFVFVYIVSLFDRFCFCLSLLSLFCDSTFITLRKRCLISNSMHLAA